MLTNQYSERFREVAEITITSATQGETLNDNELTYGATNAIDRDFSTSAVSNTGNGAGWLKLKLHKSHSIYKLMIYHNFKTDWYDSTSWCSQSWDNFKYCVNNDNNVDVSVYQGDVKQKSCGTLQLTYGPEQSDQIYTLICDTEGDTVKLTKDTGVISVTEVVVIMKCRCPVWPS